MTDYLSLLAGLSVITVGVTILSLGIRFRIAYSEWIRGHIEHSHALPSVGRKAPAKNSTPGNLLVACLGGLFIAGIIAMNVVPKLWSAPFEMARLSLLLAVAGSVLLGIGAVAVASYFPLHGRRTAPALRLRGGLILVVMGVLFVGTAFIVWG